MARVFVRLKLTLLRNGLRRGGGRGWFALVLGVLSAVVFGGAGFAGMAALDVNTAAGAAALRIVFVALPLAWMVFPVLGFGSDETIDPGRLVLYPLTVRQLIAGQLAAGLVGLPALLTVLTLAGVVVGARGRLVVGLVAAGAVVAEVALCLVASRALVSSLARLLRSRRGRDLTTLLAGIAAISFNLGRLVVDEVSRHVSADVRWIGWTTWLHWLPPGLAVRALAHAASGRTALAIVELVPLAVLVAVVTRWWSTNLALVMTTVEASGPMQRVAAGSEPLFGRWLGPRLPRTPTGATVAKELRYWSRDPRRRAALVPALVIVVVVVANVLRGTDPTPMHALFALSASVTLGLLNANQFGFDGAALWIPMAAGVPPEADLTGRNLAMLVVTLPLWGVAAIGLCVVTGGWGYLPALLLLHLGLTLAGLGVGNVVSVYAPQPLPQSRGNPWARSSTTGQGCVTPLLTMLGLVAAFALSAPVLGAAVVFRHEPARLLLAAPVTVVYGAVVWWLGRFVAAGRLATRFPEVLARIDRRAD